MWRPLLCVAVGVVAMFVMPDGPWYRVVPAFFLSGLAYDILNSGPMTRRTRPDDEDLR